MVDPSREGPRSFAAVVRVGADAGDDVESLIVAALQIPDFADVEAGVLDEGVDVLGLR
jgi:hypothetical protein